MFLSLYMCGSRGGDGGSGPPPPVKKSQKYRVSKQYWFGSPEKSQSFQASIQCWANIGTPARRHLNGVSLVGRWWPAYSGILDPSSPHQLKNVKPGPPLAKLCGSACYIMINGPSCKKPWFCCVLYLNDKWSHISIILLEISCRGSFS